MKIPFLRFFKHHPDFIARWCDSPRGQEYTALMAAATAAQEGVKIRATRYLIANKHIDAWTVLMMGTTDAHKMFTRMRAEGLLYSADDPCGHILLPNKSGHGTYRLHKWTGEYPPGWKEDQATACTLMPADIRFDDHEPERRKTVRGGRP